LLLEAEGRRSEQREGEGKGRERTGASLPT